MLKGTLSDELLVLGPAHFHGEAYWAVLHGQDPMFVYQSAWEVVPGTEVVFKRETALEQAKRLWPKSKKALREALSFAQFLGQVPQKQPGNSRLLRTLEETLGLWNVGPNRALVEHQLQQALRLLDKGSFRRGR